MPTIDEMLAFYGSDTESTWRELVVATNLLEAALAKFNRALAAYALIQGTS